MNKLFNSIPFHTKLILIVLFPLAFIVFFSIQNIQEKNQRIKIIGKIVDKIDQNLLIMNLASKMHVERRMSFSYLFNMVTENELVSSRLKTDEALASLQKNIDSGWNKFADFSMLNRLPAVRKSISKKELLPDQAVKFYSNALQRVQNLNNISVENLPYLKVIEKDINSDHALFELINYFGILRANIYSYGHEKKFHVNDLNGIKADYNLLNSLWEEYAAKATPESFKKINEITSSNEALNVSSVMDYIMANNKLPDNYDNEKWWNESGALVDKLLIKQTEFIAETKRLAQKVYENEKSDLITNVVIIIVIIILVIAIVFYSLKNILDILGNLRKAAERLAIGETNIPLNFKTRDAIGNLAQSIHTIDVASSQIAFAAYEIGRGNFDVKITPRSSNDVLGNAILRMREDLAKFSKESNDKIWVQSGLTQLTKHIRGEKSIHQLCSDVLMQLAAYIKAHKALFYITTEKQNHLHLAASYAVSQGFSRYDLEFGQTLTGQVALTREPIFINDREEAHHKITSGLMEEKPASIIIVPLIFNDSVEGVIELSSLEHFDNATLKFIEDASTSIAVAVQSTKNRLRLQELLEETQAQSEELQAQHSELENINAELEAQAAKLQSSEEELKVQQEELLEANRELEERSTQLEEKNQLILERNTEIQQKAEELEVSTRYKSEFLANMSHELRTPLNSILLLSRLLADNSFKNLTEEQMEYARVIQSSGNGLLALIDEILDLSKIEAGKMQLETSVVNIRELCSEIKQMFKPLAEEKKFNLKLNVADDVPSFIETDKLRLEQILRNLLSNALKFTTEGSVELNVYKNNKNVCFSVKDTGIGIPHEKQQLIFEAFQQADGSTRRKYGGTGLGLSISRQLARLLGGDITLQSEVGIGSTFTACLPIEKTDIQITQPAAQSIIANDPKPEKLTSPASAMAKTDEPVIPASVKDDRENIEKSDKVILIIEDDVDFAKTLMKYTHQHNYKCVIAVRGDEGLQLAQKILPTAILLDIHLPVKNGWEIMEELKANAQTKHIPVHIMSSSHAKKESISRGAVDFISKPVAFEKMSELFKRLTHWLNNDPKKVLIIEENEKHAKALAYFLESVEVSSELTASLTDTVNALTKQHVNCVIYDMGAAVNQAYDSLQKIKETEGLENVPVIFFTGKHLSQSEETKMRKYADSIVVKTAHSYQRILDEISIFLHLIEEQKNKKPATPRKLGALSNVLKNKKVLIADDDARNIFSLTKPLEMQNMQVLHAMDGKEAINILNENKDIDIILMDMMMPLMDGYDSIKQIRSKPEFRNLPIIAVTAKAMAGDREKCIQAGASDYISKPVDIDQLLSLLRVWLYDKLPAK